MTLPNGVSFPGAFAEFRNSAGRLVMQTGSGGDGIGFARYFNGDSKALAYIGATGGGGAFATFGSDVFSTAAVSIGQRSDGTGFVTVGGKTLGDFAEVFELAHREGIVPGTVMSANSVVALVPSSRFCDPRVVGVISGANGLQAGMTVGSRADGSTDLPVAVAGRVYVRVNSDGGPIQAGDLLTSSDTPGVATRVADPQTAAGCTIGKALADLPAGTGERMVLMLVFNR
jgi:hypothetical protein